MIFRCSRFPTGTAHIRTHLGVVVDFHDGVAEVNDPEVGDALLEVPAVFGITGEKPEPETPLAPDVDSLDKDALLRLAEEKGIKVDKRWGADKLAAAIREAQ